MKRLARMAGLLALLAASPALAASPSTDAYINSAAIMHRDMDIAYTGQVDSDFARGMVPHHQGAIDMAHIVLQYGKDPEIRSLAEWIKVSQEAEIAIMNRWLERRGEPEPASEPAQAAQSQAVQRFKKDMHQMHEAMNIRYTGDADIDFVCGMIPHHLGAIDMADTQITHGRDPEMLPLASGIIRSQKSDIARMERWLNANDITCRLADIPAMHHHH